ncbi:MAG: DEAD/DEAH box helicase [Acidobacteriota bacterium]|nr:DEAD/DEAH box helicase [Acidobacteriota bacterium]
MSRKPKPSNIERTAQDKLNFENLRPGQEEAIRCLLEGRDTLVVQPTGSGKSAIYQIAGLMISGSTLVVSPLIAFTERSGGIDSGAERRRGRGGELHPEGRRDEGSFSKAERGGFGIPVHGSRAA